MRRESSSLFELLLRPELVAVAALLLPAVGGTWRETSLETSNVLANFQKLLMVWMRVETYIALAADGLVAVVL